MIKHMLFMVKYVIFLVKHVIHGNNAVNLFVVKRLFMMDVMFSLIKHMLFMVKQNIFIVKHTVKHVIRDKAL